MHFRGITPTVMELHTTWTQSCISKIYIKVQPRSNNLKSLKFTAIHITFQTMENPQLSPLTARI